MQPPDQNNFKPIESESSWDNVRIKPILKAYSHHKYVIIVLQEDCPSYDPQKYVETAPVLRTLNLEKPSTRIAFRESERRRFQGFTQQKE